MVVKMEIPEPIEYDLKKIGGIKGLIKNLPKDKEIEKIGKILHGLSDKYRLKTLLIVNVQPLCVCIIKEILGIADSKLSYHLSTLKECGLIYGKQQGNWIIYYPTKLGKIMSEFLHSNTITPESLAKSN
jgi:ArsR family transcriptional regulator